MSSSRAISSRQAPERRILSQKDALAYIGKSPSYFAKNRDALHEIGFPAKVNVLDGYDIRDLDNWIETLKANGASPAANESWKDASEIKI